MTAALLAAFAVVLLDAPNPVRQLARLDAGVGPRGLRHRGGIVVLAGFGVLSVVAALFGLRVLGWVLIAGIGVGVVAYLMLGQRRRNASKGAAAETARAARTLAVLLRSGQLPRAALLLAAEDCPSLTPAATAARLGGDVAPELARSGEQPGRGGLRAVGAAWHVAERSGAPIAEVLGRVSAELRAQRALEGVLEAELSAARSSGRVMAALPFGAVLLGTAAGADPLTFLFGSPIGQLLVFLGVVLSSIGVLWIDRLASPTRVQAP